MTHFHFSLSKKCNLHPYELKYVTQRSNPRCCLVPATHIINVKIEALRCEVQNFLTKVAWFAND